MTETELVLTVVARRNRPNSFLPESYSYKKLLKRIYRLLTDKGKTSFCPPNSECHSNCGICWDKYIKMFIQNKEDQCNL